MCNLRYYDCHSGQDTQMLYVVVKMDEVTSLLSNPRQITFRLYSFCLELRLFLLQFELTIWFKRILFHNFLHFINTYM